MRVLLVQNFLLNDRGSIDDYVLYPHLGLLSLASVAEDEGHEAVLYDPMYELKSGALPLDGRLYREMARALAKSSPDVVGFTALGCNFVTVVRVAGELRKICPDVPLLLGGPHATVLHEEIARRFPDFDVIVRNEAEQILPGLLRELIDGDLATVPGLTFRRGADILSTPGSPLVDDLDTLPMPAYQKYPIGELNLKKMRVEAGRGCPFSCTFCSTASFFGRRYRLKSPERLLRELDGLASSYGINDFSLQHDLFTVDKKKVRAFCAAVRGRGYTWSCSARVDCVDDALLEDMYESGCRSIYYGVETGSPRMQKISQKHLDLALLAPRLGKTLSLGMVPTVSFITGYPEELQDDQDQTLDALGTCMAEGGDKLIAQLHLLTPEPGTKLLADNSSSLAYDGYLTDFNFPALDPRDIEIVQENPATFVNQYYFESVLPRRQHVQVASAFRSLILLGNRVVSHIVHLSGGSFSALVKDIISFVDAAAAAPDHIGITPEDVIAFATRRWGRTHHVVSLARYLFEAHRVAERLISGETKRAESWSSPQRAGYRLADNVSFLSSIHDAPRILETLRAQGQFDGACACATERVAGLLMRCDPANPSEVHTWNVNGPTSMLLRQLKKARPGHELLAGVRKREGSVAEARRLLGDLVERGFVTTGRPRVSK